MWFWWYMFVCDLLVPVIMIIAGWLLWRHCPKKINNWYGYRTMRAMKNMDTWRFAQEDCGKRWWRMGWIVLTASAVAQLPFYNSNEGVIGVVGLVLCTIQVAIIIVSACYTEKALKITFHEDGTRRT